MPETKDISSGVVTSISDTDLVLCRANGSFHPISFANLAKMIRSKFDIANSTLIALNGGEWVRVAKATTNAFSAILTVTHGWTAGRTTPLVCFINGCTSNVDGFYANQLTTADYYKVVTNPPASSNPGLSFTALRFVIENSEIFVEVKFKPNARVTSLSYSLAGQTGAISLVTATVSTADNANVLKTIEFSGGV